MLGFALHQAEVTEKEEKQKMKGNKIGAIFFISILALAVIGISYAGFADIISVSGTVNTATVDLVIEDYSGTDVWKIYGTGAPDDEILIWHGFINDPARPTQESLEKQYLGCTVLLVASSWASEGTDYDVDMEWNNIFPCIDFTADIIVHYTGSIPAHVTVNDIVWDTTGYDFSPYTTFKAYSYTDPIVWIKGDEIEFPVQMHYCEYVGIEVTIHLQQDNALQGLSGDFSFDITATQWNDACEEEPQDGDGPMEPKIITIPTDPDFLTMKVFGPFPAGYGYFRTHLTNVPIGTWSTPIAEDADCLGWCVDNAPGHLISCNIPYKTYLYDSYNLPTSLPGGWSAQPWMSDMDWPKVNWILNNKGIATPCQIQYAIWGFVDGGYFGSDPVVLALMADANANPDYIPDSPGIIATICWVDATIHGQKQVTIIEVDP